MTEDKTLQTEGIILRTIDFGDAHRVVSIYTREYGKLDVNAYGCRRPRSKLAGAMMMFNHVRVELISGPKVDMVREAELLDVFPITDDLFRIAYASLLFEIVDKMTPLNQKDEAIFFLLLNALKMFVERNPRGVYIIAACQFIAESGLQLRLDRCVVCNKKIDADCSLDVIEGGVVCSRCSINHPPAAQFKMTTRELLDELLAFNWKSESHLTLRADDLNFIEKILLAHIHAMLNRPLRSLKFLKQLSTIAPRA